MGQCSPRWEGVVAAYVRARQSPVLTDRVVLGGGVSSTGNCREASEPGQTPLLAFARARRCPVLSDCMVLYQVEFVGACCQDESNPIIFEEFVTGPSLSVRR